MPSEPVAAQSRKGSCDNPLMSYDFPFTVPETGVYYVALRKGQPPMALPEAPKGSVLDIEVDRV